MRSLTLCVVLLSSALGAQTTFVYPFGASTEFGTSGNTIPFWGGSATYQQVFDNVHMSQLNKGSVIVMKEMFFRSQRSIAARKATVQLKVNHTSTDSTNATGTFATNLKGAATDPNPTTVIPYTALSFPAFTKNLTSGMQFPFKSTFLWIPTQKKHFVFELRYKDGSPGSQNGQLDAVDGNTFTGTRRPAEGTGCKATGQTRNSQAFASLGFARGSSTYPPWTYQVDLRSARADSPAMWFLGLVRQKVTLPGACGSLLLNPLFSQLGRTSKATGGSKPSPGGSWQVRVPVPKTPDVRLLPRFELLSQFVFEDKALPYSIGLSDMAVVKTSFNGAVGVSRIFAFTSKAGNGFETATTGSKGAMYGLVTGFKQ